MIDTYAALPHYAEHIAPVFAALPPEVQGERWAPRTGCWWGTRVPGRVQPRPILLASYGDVTKMRGRPYVYLEHGAGQVYLGDDRAATAGSYSGGPGHDRAVLFLAPGAEVADRWLARYPHTPAAAVGCPKLDPWHLGRRRPGDHDTSPVVAITFHWDCPLVPETRSAARWFQPGLAALVGAVRAMGGTVLGHGHPRAWQACTRLWHSLGVEPVERLADVLDRADLLVADNTSAAVEFASTGRPVMWLNAPWYRREVHHGGRFWQWPAGQVQVDDPRGLVAGLEQALADEPAVRASRAAMVASVYAACDGHAAGRAAAAIVEVLTHAEPQGAA